MRLGVVTPELDLNESSFMSMASHVTSSPIAPSYSPLSSDIVSPANSLVEITPSSNTSASDHELETVACLSAPATSSTPQVPLHKEWYGFKIVMDNLDMNIRPRYQTFERQTKSIHYVNSYALRDRVDLSQFQNVDHNPELDPEILYNAILPTDNDHQVLMANFAILAGRILAEVIPALSAIPGLTTDHIEHPHSKEMSTKSEVVRL